LGISLAAVSGLWLVLLQNASAVAAGMPWIVEHPWLNLILYPIVFGFGAVIATVVLETARRLLFPRRSPWAWTVAWVSMFGFGLRSFATAASSANTLPGGLPTAFAANGLVVLCLVALANTLLQKREPSSFAGAFGLGCYLLLPTLAGVYLFHVVFLTDRHQVSQWGLIGLPILGILAAIGAASLLLGRVMWPPDRSSEGNTTRPRVVAASALALLILGALYAQAKPNRGAALSAPIPDGPNVLLIVLDTLRRDAVSSYGIVEGVTPHLDAFAAQGVLWEDAIATGSWTIPSHASLFTGALVSRHGSGVRRKKLREHPTGIHAPRLPTLAEVMQRRGWNTAAFVNNGQLNRAFSYDRGFSKYYEMWSGSRGNYDTLGGSFFKRFGLAAQDKGGRRTNRALASWFASQARSERPAFCFINYVEPHAPYDPPKEWRDRFLKEGEDSEKLARWQNRTWRKALSEHRFGGADPDEIDRYWRLYLASVAYQDQVIGEMLADLDASGMADNTVVIITSDHGENFGWHDQLDHGWELNDDLIRIPLLARGPGIPVGAREKTPASLIDIFPTVMHLTGGPPMPNDPGRPGIALPPIVADPSEAHLLRPRVAERYRAYLADPVEFEIEGAEPHWALERTALLLGPWKFVDVDEDGTDRLMRSVAPESDPAGSPIVPPFQDGRVQVDNPAQLVAMSDTLSDLRAGWLRADDPSIDDLPNLSKDSIEQLKALGYLN